MDNNLYAFVLGREHELCMAELQAVLLYYGIDFSISYQFDNIAILTFADQEPNVNELIGRLAGTIKIFKIIGDMDKEFIKNYLSSKYSSKFSFGVSDYSKTYNTARINKLGFSVKFDLKKSSLSARYNNLKEGSDVPTIISISDLLGRKGIELGIFKFGSKMVVGELAAVNDPRSWSVRDYEKPAGDKYSGMLPPKLARTMINLSAASAQVSSSDTKDVFVYDPFCGSGNLIIESLLLGFDTSGSDVSTKAITDSEINLNWFKENSKRFGPDEVVASSSVTLIDATSPSVSNIFEHLSPETKKLLVVTEPYLGEPKKYKPSYNAAYGEYEKVKKLYLDFLQNFKNTIEKQPQNRQIDVYFCVVFPLVETIENKRFSLYNKSVDEIEKIGYTEIRSPLVYGRDYQVVKRELIFLKLIQK